MPDIKTLLSIAGSDPSGGAGIQADLKTMTALGVYGAAAITCLTVQNSTGVKNILPLEPGFIKQQIEAVLDDHSVPIIKIGMLGAPGIVRKISELLSTFKGEIVLDPVLASTSGESFLTNGGIELIRAILLQTISYLTPNRYELASLTGRSVVTDKDGIECARSLLAIYPNIKGVAVKGGHFGEEKTTVSDFLLLRNGQQIESTRQRIVTDNLHGTGCTFATAFSSYLLLGNSSEAAFKKTGAFMEKLIHRGKNSRICKSDTNGPLLHSLGAVR